MSRALYTESPSGPRSTGIRWGTLRTMYEEDYILRVIDQMGIMLRAMLSEVRQKKTEQVYETSRESMQVLLGLPPTVAETLTADGFVAMLSVGGEFDTKRGRLVAEVLTRRAQAAARSGDAEVAASEAVKATRLIALVIEAGDDDDVAEARALAEQLRDPAADPPGDPG